MHARPFQRSDPQAIPCSHYRHRKQLRLTQTRIQPAAMRVLLVALPALLLGLAGGAAKVDARPKSVHQVCNLTEHKDKIQDPRAEECLKKTADDVMNGDPNPHFLLCLLDGGVSCCKEFDRASGGKGRRCDRIFRVDTGTLDTIGTDGVLDPGPTTQPRFTPVPKTGTTAQ